jgi:hypothetical protein
MTQDHNLHIAHVSGWNIPLLKEDFTKNRADFSTKVELSGQMSDFSDKSQTFMTQV